MPETSAWPPIVPGEPVTNVPVRFPISSAATLTAMVWRWITLPSLARMVKLEVVPADSGPGIRVTVVLATAAGDTFREFAWRVQVSPGFIPTQERFTVEV